MISLRGIKLKNRFVVSSGALEYGRGWPWERPLIKLGLIDPRAFGAVVTKTLTLEPRKGNYIDPFEFEKSPIWSIFYHDLIQKDRRIKNVVRRTPHGWINSLGLWNIGIDYWIGEIYPKLKDVSLIVSIAGSEEKEYLGLIRRLSPLDITAIELNLFCPNVRNPFFYWSQTGFERFFIACRSATEHPLIIKVENSEEAFVAALAARDHGINAISAVNSLPLFGEGWSGKGIKQTALKVVSRLKNEVGLPVIGGGGIESWPDCQKFFAAGADAVSFGSIHFTKPWKPTCIVRRHGQE